MPVQSPSPSSSDSSAARCALRWLRRAIFWAVVVAVGYYGWPHVPSIVKAPFYGMQLAMMDAPTHISMPVQGVRASRVADTWGAARGNGRRHEGLDIFAPRGTPVLSATEGIVTRVGTNNLGGQVVWVLGPAGQRHYYAHLDSYADIASGDRVQAGTVLGAVGNTGNARGTPPHLHYGIYGREGAFNPYPLLQEPRE